MDTLLRPLTVSVLLALGLCSSTVLGFENEPNPPFLYASESTQKILLYGSDGRVTWEYPAPLTRDAWRLPNGNILFSYNRDYDSRQNDNPSGVIEVSPDKKVVWEFKTTGQVFSCQRLANGDTLVGAASQGRLLVVNREGQIVKTVPLKNKPGHSCMRYARAVEGGNFIVAEESARTVREYGSAGALLREITLDFPPFSVVRLKNGNTMIGGKTAIVEVDRENKTVWKLDAKELPQLGVRWFATVQVLPNGHLFVCNAGGKVPFFEITRDSEKRIIWQSNSEPGEIPLGHAVQRLDVPAAGALR